MNSLEQPKLSSATSTWMTSLSPRKMKMQHSKRTSTSRRYCRGGEFRLTCSNSRQILTRGFVAQVVAIPRLSQIVWLRSIFIVEQAPIRTTSWILRFVNNCRKGREQRESGSITMREYNKAKDQVWIKRAQTHSFPLEVHDLKAKTPISRQSRILTLSPFLDNFGCASRTNMRSDPLFHPTSDHPLAQARCDATDFY